MPAYLVPLREGRTIPIAKAVVFVGRHPECDVVLTRSRKVSRKHCCIVQADDRYFVRDLGSMNGVRVNGRRVQNEAPLAFGDEIAIADVHYRMSERPELDGHQPAAVAASAKQTADAPQRDVSELSLEYPVPIAEESGFSGPHVDDAEDDVIPLASDSGQVVPLVDSGLEDDRAAANASSDFDDEPNELPDAADDASDWNRAIVD